MYLSVVQRPPGAPPGGGMAWKSTATSRRWRRAPKVYSKQVRRDVLGLERDRSAKKVVQTSLKVITVLSDSR